MSTDKPKDPNVSSWTWNTLGNTRIWINCAQKSLRKWPHTATTNYNSNQPHGCQFSWGALYIMFENHVSS